MGARIVIGRCRYDDKISPLISLMLIQRRCQIKRPMGEVMLQFAVCDGRFTLIDELHFFSHQVEGYHFVVLGK
ncbi:hypothetical protein D3C73_1238480 [compost metagenome]